MANDSKGNLGLLFASDAITAVLARYVNGRVEVVASGSVATPTGAVEGASLHDPDRLGQAIRVLIREMGIRVRTASVALVSPGYSMRTVRLPEVPDRERRQLVRGELEEVGAIPYGGGGLGFLWVGAPTLEGKRQADAFAYYTSDAEIDSAREALRIAGLSLGRIEPASLAMMRAYLASRIQPEPVAILCPSSKHSDLCIHDGRQVRSIRQIPSGWSDLVPTRASADPVGLTIAGPNDPGTPLVENALGRQPFSQPDEDIPGDARSFQPPPVETSTEDPVLTSIRAAHSAAASSFLASEVARSLAFYAREYPDAPRPESLVILGPERVTVGLASLLQDSSSLPIISTGILDSVDMPRTESTLSGDKTGVYLAAIGAAVDGTDATLPAVDISQQEVSARARRRAPATLLVGMAGSTIWMLVSAIAAVSLTYLESNAQTESARILQETERIKTERAPLLKQMESVNFARGAQVKDEVPVAAVLGRLAASTTPGVTVTSLRVGQDGKVQVEGQAVTPTEIQQFAQALGIGVSVRRPVFEMMRQDDKGGLTFRIVGVSKHIVQTEQK